MICGKAVELAMTLNCSNIEMIELYLPRLDLVLAVTIYSIMS